MGFRPIDGFSGVVMSKKQVKEKTGVKAAKSEKRATKSADASVSSATKSAERAPKKAASKRKLGARGASPWAARHAEKHAAEARARAEAPLLPGSARATVRVPTGAEEIKARVAGLHNALVQIRSLRKNFAKGFYEVGLVLRDIQTAKLYEAKGYGSFESFLEREIDLGKLASLQLVRMATVFQKEAALEYGHERCIAALVTLEQPAEATTTGVVTPPVVAQSATKLPLPLKPPASRTG